MADPANGSAMIGRPPQTSSADEHNRRLVANIHPTAWTNPTPAGRYNLVVVGAGTASLVTAAGAAGLGARVALIERDLMGGDCLNVGCVPSKALIRAAPGSARMIQRGDFESWASMSVLARRVLRVGRWSKPGDRPSVFPRARGPHHCRFPASPGRKLRLSSENDRTQCQSYPANRDFAGAHRSPGCARWLGDARVYARPVRDLGASRQQRPLRNVRGGGRDGRRGSTDQAGIFHLLVFAAQGIPGVLRGPHSFRRADAATVRLANGRSTVAEPQVQRHVHA
ncbi:MAG: FAD-dependent oxidoreductase [Planctomycetia bacterium]|nr:FAD-dependent oxidoreductase [Planctomycetia bacterium]MCC7315665.1 FAD-dependent oxidoreductase [Planctomycetota bacterium]